MLLCLPPCRYLQNSHRYPGASHAGASLQGVATKEVRHGPLPVTPTFFSDRIEGLSTAVSASLYDALHSGSLLDEKGLLKADPRFVRRCMSSVTLSCGPAPCVLRCGKAGTCNSLICWLQKVLCCPMYAATTISHDGR